MFPDACHHMSAWYLQQNVFTNVHIKDFINTFSRCMFMRENPKEFKHGLHNMVEKLGLHENYWVIRGERTNDGSDHGNDGGDVRQQQQSGQPLAFTCENDFTHCTQDEDHCSRRVGLGVGAIGKPYRGRQRRMIPCNEDSLSANLESMSIRLNSMTCQIKLTCMPLM